MTNFILSADLGLSGIGCPYELEIKYKDGTKVDEKRVMKAVNKMIEICNKNKEKYIISDPKFIGIYEVIA